MKKISALVLVLAMASCFSLAYGGQKSSARDITPRIVGGERVSSPETYPWMAALGNLEEDDEEGEMFSQFCGGSLIGDKWVLTASHCIMSDSGGVLDTDDLYVLLGTLDNQDTESGELVKVRRIIDHPDYDPEKTSSDIALLELEKSVSGYTPVELYRGSDTLADTPCTVIGWGNTVGYNHPDEAEDPWMLRHVSISIVSQEQCIQAYSSDEIDSTMMCAGTEEGGKDSCQGDSGGPLVIKEGGVWKQAGVVSWGGGSECAEKGSYGVYARVSEFISFIDGYTAGTSIWGKISVSVAGHDDLGVKNATVSVEGTDYKTVTNEQGRFSLMIPKGGISPGDYTVSVNASGLVSSTQPITVQGQEGEGIEVNKKLLLSQNGGIPGDFSGNNVLGLEDSIGILQFLTGKK